MQQSGCGSQPPHVLCRASAPDTSVEDSCDTGDGFVETFTSRAQTSPVQLRQPAPTTQMSLDGSEEITCLHRSSS